MDTRIIKVAITLGVFGWSVFQFTQGNIGSGIWLLLLGALLAFLVTRSIRLIIAFIFLRRGNAEKSMAWVNRVNPDHLFPKSKGYFYYLQGLTSVQSGGHGSLTKAESLFKKAISNGLRLDLDRATAKLQLAVIAISKRKKREATNLLAEVKKLDKRGMMTAQIKQVKEGLKRL